MSLLDHLIYALAWLGFGAVHSALAGARAKARLGRWLGPAYRLTYNILSGVLLGAVWLTGRALGAHAAPFALPGWAEAAMSLLALAGGLLIIHAARGYDLGRFSGVWHVRHKVPLDVAEADEPLVTDALHRYVRHPIYSAAFLILWGLVRDPLSLATALWASAYLIVGTRFEERALRRRYGAAYAAYQRRVPAFIPWRGRAPG